MKEIDRNLFYELGLKEGIEFWIIKNSLPSRPIFNPRILHDVEVCLVLETRISLYGVATYRLHIWVGSRASAEDVAHAQRHAATMDLLLRHRVTVHLERQHQECEQFLAYFAPFIEYSSEPRRHDGGCGPLPRENKLYAIYPRGKYLEVKQLECSVSSVNQRDPLVLITEELSVYVLPLRWDKRVIGRIGSNLQVEEWIRSRDISVVQALHYDVIQLGSDATFEDWKDFYKVLGWDDPDTCPAIPEGGRREVQICQPNYKLFEILRNRKGNIYYKEMRFPVRKEDLDSRSLFILSNGQHDVHLWIGKNNHDRNKAKMYGLAKIQEFMTHFKLPSCAHMTIIPEGLEPMYFKKQFKNWILD